MCTAPDVSTTEPVPVCTTRPPSGATSVAVPAPAGAQVTCWPMVTQRARYSSRPHRSGPDATRASNRRAQPSASRPPASAPGSMASRAANPSGGSGHHRLRPSPIDHEIVEPLGEDPSHLPGGRHQVVGPLQPPRSDDIGRRQAATRVSRGTAAAGQSQPEGERGGHGPGGGQPRGPGSSPPGILPSRPPPGSDRRRGVGAPRPGSSRRSRDESCQGCSQPGLPRVEPEGVARCRDPSRPCRHPERPYSGDP